MAILHVTQLSDLERDAKGSPIMVGKYPAIAHTTVDFTSGETDSGAFDGKTKFVRLWADVDVYIAFGDAPTASSTTLPMTGKVAEYFGVVAGHRVSVVAQ